MNKYHLFFSFQIISLFGYRTRSGQQYQQFSNTTNISSLTSEVTRNVNCMSPRKLLVRNKSRHLQKHVQLVGLFPEYTKPVIYPKLTKNLICASRNTYKFPFLLLAGDNTSRNSLLQKYFALSMAHDFKSRTARYCPAEIVKDCLFLAKL